MLDSRDTNGISPGEPANMPAQGWERTVPHAAVTAANGCDQPCPFGNFYHCCILSGPHDGAHYCDQHHSW